MYGQDGACRARAAWVGYLPKTKPVSPESGNTGFAKPINMGFLDAYSCAFGTGLFQHGRDAVFVDGAQGAGSNLEGDVAVFLR